MIVSNLRVKGLGVFLRFLTWGFSGLGLMIRLNVGGKGAIGCVWGFSLGFMRCLNMGAS